MIGALHPEAPLGELDVGGSRLEQPRRDPAAARHDLVRRPGHHHRAQPHRAAGVRAAAERRLIGVAGDQTHLLVRDAEPLHEQLRKAGLVALAGRQGSQHDVDPPLGMHRDLRALARHAGVELDVVAETDAPVAAARSGFGAARLEARPVGQRHHAVLGRRIVAAVVEQAERIAVRHGGGGHEVAPPQRHAIEAVAPGGQIDRALDDEHHLRPAGGAIGRGRRRVAQHRAPVHHHRRHVVHAGGHADALGQRNERHGVRADVAGVVPPRKARNVPCASRASSTRETRSRLW